MKAGAVGVGSTEEPSDVASNGRPAGPDRRGVPYRAADVQASQDNPGRHRRRESRGTVQKQRVVVRGIWWVFATAVSGRMGTLVIGLALARMTSPREFGAFAVVIVALLAVRSLDQFGAGQAIASWRGEPGEIAPTVTTVSLVLGAASYAGCYAAAPAFVATMGAPAAAVGVIRILGLNLLLCALAAAPAGVIKRRSPRAIKVLVEQTDNWIGVGTTIGLAATGHGLMSVAVGRLSGAAVSVILCFAFAPGAVRIGFRPEMARTVLRTGLPFAASGVLMFAVTNADQIVIGRFLSTTELGYYVLAVCLATWPVTLCSQPVRDIAPAVFARFRLGPRVVGSAFLSSADLLACLTVPICLVISSSAGHLVQVAYGPVWAPAAHALVWLAPLAVLRAFYELTLSFMVARAARVALIVQFLFYLTLVPILVLGVRWRGIVGVSMAGVAVCALYVTPAYLREVARIGIRPRVMAGRLAAVAAIVSLALVVRRYLLPDGNFYLVAAGVAAFVVMGWQVYRMRAVLKAVRGAAVGTRLRWAMDRLPAELGSMYEPSLRPALTFVQPAPNLVAETSSELEDLGGKVRSGTKWSILNTAVLRIGNFAAGVLLARTVFGPAAFGLYAVSQVILSVLLSANELGVSLAVVRWEGNVRDFARTVFTLSVASSVAFYGALFVTAPHLARLLGSPHATTMIRVISVSVVIDGLACVPLALLTRTFAQRQMMLTQALTFVVSTGVTFWLAFSGYGPISFAWGSLAGVTVGLIAATILAPFVVLPGWNAKQARELLRFGLPLAGASFLVLAIFNVDSAIVGGLLGPVALGLYQLAFNVSSWPSRSISEIFRRVSFAGFSRVAGSPELLADTFVRAFGLVMAATVPASVLLATLAEPLVRYVYGPRWVGAAQVLSWLAVLGLLRVGYDLVYDCLAAAGRRPSLLAVQGWWLVALIPVLIVGAHARGIVGVGIGHVLVAGPLVGPAFLWALSRCGIKVRSILSVCLRPTLGGILMTAVCELALRLLGPGLVGFAVAVVAGLAAYVPVVLPMRALLRRTEAGSQALGEVRAV